MAPSWTFMVIALGINLFVADKFISRVNHYQQFLTAKGLLAMPAAALFGAAVYFSAKNKTSPLTNRKAFRLFGLFVFMTMIFYVA